LPFTTNGQWQNAFALWSIKVYRDRIVAMQYRDINFDGLVGPTHNYAGLSLGNKASCSHKWNQSSPRTAALQGLLKAKHLHDRGYPQAILPPHPRPSLKALRNWGLSGRNPQDLLERAARNNLPLLAAASSASSMWSANACTMTPSIDSRDGRAHFTPANLQAKLHRSIESDFTTRTLRAIFPHNDRFVVHEPLRGGNALSDEGAANHTRLCPDGQSPGLHVFVYGRSVFQPCTVHPRKYPARQTRESFEAIARRHGIPDNQVVYLQQSPKAIDAGVFHNDVIAVGHGSVYLFHEDAYLDPVASRQKLEQAYHELTGTDLCPILVHREEVSLEDAVSTYLFNSQLLDLPGGGLLLVVPSECMDNERVSHYLGTLLDDPDNPVRELLVFDLRESMHNGGGPACLRNRITLNASEERHLHGRIILDDALYKDLTGWINRHYREILHPEDLGDPQLLQETQAALSELESLLHLPGLYKSVQ
jgi:succinylarginine dihydrolase